VSRPPPELIGHRGAPREQPENSLPAILRALELGADAVELDVHATRDGVVVVHHEPAPKRPGAGGERSRPIAERTRAELAAFKLADGIGIPTLAEVLVAVGERATVYVEIKGRGIERATLDCIRDAGTRCAVHAFDHRVSRDARALAPGVPTGILSVSYVLQPAAELARAGARDYWQEWSLIDDALVREIHGAGGRVIAWTVNRATDAERLLAMGVDGICTDAIPVVAPAVRGAR
jgi:glycerophosphoryl diester phosphodiesterase